MNSVVDKRGTITLLPLGGGMYTAATSTANVEKGLKVSVAFGSLMSTVFVCLRLLQQPDTWEVLV